MKSLPIALVLALSACTFAPLARAEFCDDLKIAARHAQNGFSAIRGQKDSLGAYSVYSSKMTLAGAPVCQIMNADGWSLDCDWDYTKDSRDKAIADGRRLAAQIGQCFRMAPEEHHSNYRGTDRTSWTVPYLGEATAIDFQVVVSERTKRSGQFERVLTLTVDKQI